MAPFAQLFSDRVWRHAQVLMVGALLAPGKRTLRSCLRVRGLAWESPFPNYHRVWNRATGSALQARKILLGLIVVLRVPGGVPGVFGADETVERRSGRKLTAKGCAREVVRSSRPHGVKGGGRKWVSLLGLVPGPWARRVWAVVPGLMARGQPKGKAHKGRHKTRVDWGRQIMQQARRWLPTRLLVLVVDGGFAAVALTLACVASPGTRGARLRWAAALSHPPAPPPPRKRGRKPPKGKRPRSLKGWAARSATPWAELEVDWDRGERPARGIFSRTALWAPPGPAPGTIRFGLGRAPEDKLSDAAFFCPDPQATPERILGRGVMRGAVEVTFEEARAHLGLETQRQGSDQAIARTSPVLLGLFSLVTVLALRRCPSGQIPVETTAWSPKAAPTFSDWLPLVRRQLWWTRYWVNSAPQAALGQFPREAFEYLLSDLPLPA